MFPFVFVADNSFFCPPSTETPFMQYFVPLTRTRVKHLSSPFATWPPIRAITGITGIPFLDLDSNITSPIYRTCSLNSRKCGVPCRCHSRQTPNLVFRVLSIHTLALKAASIGVMSPSHRLPPDYLQVLCPHHLFSLAPLNFLTRLPNAVTACELYCICMQIKK